MLLGVDLADDAGELMRDVGGSDGVSDVRGGHLFREPNTGEPGWEMSRSSAPRMISAATARQGRSRLVTRSHDFAGWQSTATSRFRETAELVAVTFLVLASVKG